MSNCSTTRLPREAAELNTKSQCFPSIGQNQPAFIFVLSRLGATGLKRIAGTGAAVKGVKCLLPDVLDEIYKKRESSGGLFALSDVSLVLWVKST